MTGSVPRSRNGKLMLLAACVAAALVMDRAIIWLASEQAPPIITPIAAPAWPSGVPDWWPPPKNGMLQQSVFGSIEMTDWFGELDQTHYCMTGEYRSGFPFRSGSCVFALYGGSRMSPDDQQHRSGFFRPAAFESIWVRGVSGTNGRIPLKPILSGLFGNLVVWTIVFLLAWCAACVGVQRLTRRWRRARGNQCIGCGYDLTGIAIGVCPECGRCTNLAD